MKKVVRTLFMSIAKTFIVVNPNAYGKDISSLAELRDRQ